MFSFQPSAPLLFPGVHSSVMLLWVASVIRFYLHSHGSLSLLYICTYFVLGRRWVTNRTKDTDSAKRLKKLLTKIRQQDTEKKEEIQWALRQVQTSLVTPSKQKKIYIILFVRYSFPYFIPMIQTSASLSKAVISQE